MQQEDENSEEEFVGEEDGGEPTIGGPTALKRLRERLKKAVEEKQEYLDGWQRARADLINYKKEEDSRFKIYDSRTKTDLVEELLPVLDSLELSVVHANDDSRKGLYGILSQFLSALKRIGVEKIDAEKGTTFDNTIHEALQEEAVEDKELDHTVIKIKRAGYRLGDRVIRPAQVVVGVFGGKDS